MAERSNEAAAMLALHDALRNVCINYDWTYSVFWTIRPRPRCRGGTTCKVGEDNGSLMLMWEDGYCHLERPMIPSNYINLMSNMQQRFLGHGGEYQQLHQLENNLHNVGAMCNGIGIDQVDSGDGEDPIWKAFRKMSIQLYNYGEGLMGKVASDKCHKWVFKESPECEAGISSYWQSSFDAHPPEWVDQFAAGIQTIAVIQAGQGLLQLGACKVIAEDLHFVLRMRHAFESLEYPSSGLFLGGPFAVPGACGGGAAVVATNNMMSRPNILSSMYTAAGLPPPPSPHSWSLGTTGNLSAGLLLKPRHPETNDSHHDILNNLQSPRLTLTPSPRTNPGGRDSGVNMSNITSNHNNNLHMVASPSSSKLYQRRFSLMPGAKINMHPTGLPFLTNVANTTPTSISSLEALLSQRSPLHAGGTSHAPLRTNTQ